MQKQGVVVLLAALVIGLGILYALGLLPRVGIPSFTATSTPQATTTQHTGEIPQPDFSNLPTHVLPAGAVAIDRYFYTFNNQLYLNSVHVATSSKLQNIRVSSFKRLTAFTRPTIAGIERDCVKAGEYAFYGDSQQLFFYQIWLNSSFKLSRLEGVIGARPTELEIVSPTTFKAGRGIYDIDYVTGTSTCMYVLKLRA